MTQDLVPVALAGGTGFTGRRVARLLAGRGIAAVCLVRSSSDLTVLPNGAVASEGDLADPASLDRWLGPCRSLIYCASMGFGHVPGVLAACARAGVERAVFVSTTAIFTTLPAPSKSARQAAEEAVAGSALRATIVRPTMIYGAPGDRNVERLLRFVARWPVVPVPGTGQSLVQPVHVDDLAAAIVEAWARDQAVGQSYALSGATPLSLDAVIDAAASACGRARRKVHLPLGPVAGFLGAFEALGLRPPVKREQVLRLAEDKAFPHDAAARDLGFAPRGFVEGVRDEARALRLTLP